MSFCEFERKEIEVVIDGKRKTKLTGSRVAPKSSPVFQEFRIWQVLNNLILSGTDATTQQKWQRPLDEDEKATLADALNYCSTMPKNVALKLLYGNKGKNFDLNYKVLEGNRTIAALYSAYLSIVNMERTEGNEYKTIDKAIIRYYFLQNNLNTDILDFNSNVSATELEQEEVYRLWHLLYSYEGDNSNSGIEKLLLCLQQRYGFTKEQAKYIADIKLEDDYCNLSTKAIRNILPYMRDGKKYDEACLYAGYKFSKQSLTREEINARPLKERLQILPKNSLRNPVVEKIVNQLINVVNSIIDTYGKPDEIRIEMARELKKTAQQRKDMTDNINAETRKQQEYRRILQEEFGLTHVSRNDIIRYKLYLELASNGYKTLYSNTYIPREKLFSKEFDIEHIIPQARLFDDSFSNKTLEARQINIEKSNQTAYDYIEEKYGANELETYKTRVEDLFKAGAISYTKRKNLLMKEKSIPQDFLNRDLTDSAYIAKKAKELLLQIAKEVHTTTGSITDRLRQDWQLVNVLQELNWNKYATIGQTEYVQDHDGRQIGRIKDWTKRNDHRHHAMDALTIAFTRPEFVNYLNNLNARSDKSGTIYAIEKQYLQRNEAGKLVFTPPIPLKQFRAEALRQLENTLVSIKAKNKVTTKNINKIKNKNGYQRIEQQTPRGQLHNETVYGKRWQYVTKIEKVDSNFTAEKIATVANKAERDMLMTRLRECGNDTKKAFTGKNAPKLSVKTVNLEAIYTVRKNIDKDINIDKVMDRRIQALLQARLAEYGNDKNKAFSNLDENPIYLNKERNITIKRVTIGQRLENAVALHDKHDHLGRLLHDSTGESVPTDYVDPRNNHHIAIYQDDAGKYYEKVTSFYEAVSRQNQGLPVIDKTYNAILGWHFLFSMKQNEYFVFPNEATGFLPQEIDLLAPANYAAVSPNLYRVQKLSSKYYVFRHHLETRVDDDQLAHKNITWKRVTALKDLHDIVKVRINHIGQIVSVGEY